MTDAERKKFLEAQKRLLEAAEALNAAWIDGWEYANAYPLTYSFDEVVFALSNWHLVSVEYTKSVVTND